MFKKALLLSSICFVILCTSNVLAIGFPKIKSLTGGAKSQATVSKSGLSSSKANAVTAYLASTRELTQSLEKAGEAFGVKKEVLEKLAVVNSLKEGNINNNDLDKARKASEEASQIIKQKMDETTAPSIESKKLMAQSMVHLSNGIQKEIELVGTVQNLSSQAQGAVNSASPMEMIKIKDIASTALILVKAIPNDLALAKNILSSYMQYAKANNIKVPEKATSLLKDE